MIVVGWVWWCHTEIATAFSKPRNDDARVLSLRGVKRRSNPQTTKVDTKTEKKKNSPLFTPLSL